MRDFKRKFQKKQEQVFAGIRKKVKKVLGTGKKQKNFTTFTSGDAWTYHSNEMGDKLSLKWMKHHCKNTRSIMIEYHEQR